MRWFEQAPPEVRGLLSKPIKELGLRLEGSPIERYVSRLYRELARKGLDEFRPLCYLTDEWGCPSGQPVIGIPFYLADPKLAKLEQEMNDLEDERQIMMYLRHEAGHAFNYAHELYKREDWRALFGPFRRPYREDYRPIPFSRRFVRHIEGWYAQKHPDEDFAETFAVWLTPRSNWRKKYAQWGALDKLRYVDRMARALRKAKPARPWGTTDVTVEEMETTVEEFYRKAGEEQSLPAELPLDADLQDIFLDGRRRKKGIRPAADLLREARKALTDKITYWTGVRRPLVKLLVETIEARVRELGLVADSKRDKEHLAEITAYATTLAISLLRPGRRRRDRMSPAGPSLPQEPAPEGGAP